MQPAGRHALSTITFHKCSQAAAGHPVFASAELAPLPQDTVTGKQPDQHRTRVAHQPGLPEVSRTPGRCPCPRLASPPFLSASAGSAWPPERPGWSERRPRPAQREAPAPAPTGTLSSLGSRSGRRRRGECALPFPDFGFLSRRRARRRGPCSALGSWGFPARGWLRDEGIPPQQTGFPGFGAGTSLFQGSGST